MKIRRLRVGCLPSPFKLQGAWPARVSRAGAEPDEPSELEDDHEDFGLPQPYGGREVF